MACYMLCIKKPTGEKGMYEHAGHYLGYSDRDLCEGDIDSVLKRLAEHRNGRGSALTRAVVDAGLTFEISRVWLGATMGDEKLLRKRKQNPDLCPHCNPHGWHRLAMDVGVGSLAMVQNKPLSGEFSHEEIAELFTFVEQAVR
jgi:hypothetical protein